MKAASIVLVVVLTGVGLVTVLLNRHCDRSEPPGANDDDPAERRAQPYAGPMFYATSNASAAVAVDEQTFIVADDENNVLRVYRTDGRQAVSHFDLTRFLKVAGEFPEVDIEAATRVGNRVYWVASHGRNRNGKWRPNRHRFFATELTVVGAEVTIRPVGRPCTELGEALAGDQALRTLCPDIVASVRPDGPGAEGRKSLASKKRGVNIEALCAGRDGKTLYIGLRNPRARAEGGSESRAVVMPLLNAPQVIDQARSPVLGKPLLWDLGDLGLRGMEYSPRHDSYYVIAGPHDGRSEWVLYRWSGAPDAQPVPVHRMTPDQRSLTPEALIAFKDTDKLLLLSDDGSLLVRVSGAAECLDGQYRSDGTCPNKYLRDESKKTFRGLWLEPPPG